MIEPELLDRIDADRKAKGQTRSEWLARAAELALFDPDGTDPVPAEQPRRETVRKPARPLAETPSRIPGQAVAARAGERQVTPIPGKGIG